MEVIYLSLKLQKNNMKNPIIFLFVLCTSFVFAQNNSSTITFKDGSKKQFKNINFQYNGEDYIVGLKTKTDTNENGVYTLNDVVSVRENNVNYKTKQYKNSLYLLEDIILGSLSLYKSGGHYFLDNEEYGLREIPKVVIDEKTLNRFDYATLTLYVNKCKEAQELAYNKNQSISISALKDIVETFNTCSLSEDTQFAENIIELANAPSEFIELAVNVGYSFVNAEFDDLSPDVSNKYGTPVIGVQVYMNTNILNKRLGFIASVDYSLPKEFNSASNNIFLNTKTAYLSAMIGARYTFNNIDKTFSPYLGANGGFLFNSSSITKQENIVGSPIYDYDTTNELNYNFCVGTYIHFGNQKLDFNLMYQPELTLDLEYSDNLSSQINFYSISGFQLKVSYLF